MMKRGPSLSFSRLYPLKASTQGEHSQWAQIGSTWDPPQNESGRQFPSTSSFLDKERKIIVSHFVLSRSVMSNSWRPHGLQPTRLLRPWDSPGRNSGVGCHFLLREIFPTQGLNPGLLYCRQTLYHLSHQGSLIFVLITHNYTLGRCMTHVHLFWV